MSAEIIPLRNTDTAWESYQTLASRLADNARLAADRTFMEEFARREAEWKRLYLRECGR